MISHAMSAHLTLVPLNLQETSTDHYPLPLVCPATCCLLPPACPASHASPAMWLISVPPHMCLQHLQEVFVVHLPSVHLHDNAISTQQRHRHQPQQWHLVHPIMGDRCGHRCGERNGIPADTILPHEEWHPCRYHPPPRYHVPPCCLLPTSLPCSHPYAITPVPTPCALFSLSISLRSSQPACLCFCPSVYSSTYLLICLLSAFLPTDLPIFLSKPVHLFSVPECHVCRFTALRYHIILSSNSELGAHAQLGRTADHPQPFAKDQGKGILQCQAEVSTVVVCVGTSSTPIAYCESQVTHCCHHPWHYPWHVRCRRGLPLLSHRRVCYVPRRSDLWC